MNSFFVNFNKGSRTKRDNESNGNTLEDVLNAFNSDPCIEKIIGKPLKATHVGEISADMLKSTVDVHLPFVTKIINFSFENGCFSDELKLAEIRPIFKKNKGLDKENVSILSHVSNVFGKIMRMQIDAFIRDKISKVLTGFRGSHSIHHCLMFMLEMWKNTLHKGGYVSTFL